MAKAKPKEPADLIPVRGQRNIGTTIANRLRVIGIETMADLRAVGAAAAYRQLAARYPGQSLPKCYYLYSLQGALDDKHWDDLKPSLKQQLDQDAGIHGSRRSTTNTITKGRL